MIEISSFNLSVNLSLDAVIRQANAATDTILS